MQQFNVPQFIDVEDKIIGPITTRQFIIMLVAFIICAIFYKIFDFSLFAFSSVLLLASSGTLAFARVNGRPFHFFILNVAQTLGRPALRIWKKQNNEIMENFIKPSAINQSSEPKIYKQYSKSRLAELSLVVDTGGAYENEE